MKKHAKKQILFIFLLSYFIVLNYYLGYDASVLGGFRTKSVIVISLLCFLIKFGFKDGIKYLVTLDLEKMKLLSIIIFLTGIFISFFGAYQLTIHEEYRKIDGLDYMFYMISFSPLVLSIVSACILFTSSFLGTNDARDKHTK